MGSPQPGRDSPEAVIRSLSDDQVRLAGLTADLSAELAGIVDGAATDVPDDEHDVEGSSLGFERAKVTALLRATRGRSALVDSALADARAGTRRPCRSCSGSIPLERSTALPGVDTCVRCAGQAERSRRWLGAHG